ncbi:MAG TPA: hypothetical protein VF360_01205, partial [Candidatus Methanoperedens sp.]
LLIVPEALHLSIAVEAHPGKITPNGRGSAVAIHGIAFLSHSLILYRDIKKNERKLMDKHNGIECWFKGLKSFINCSGLLIIFFIYMSLSLIKYSKIPVSSSEIDEILNLYTISITITVFTLIILKWNHDEFLDKIKSKLSTQYSNGFPFIHITTEDREVTGKIQDIFDKDLVILDDNGLQTAVEWNMITILGLKE